MPAIKEILTNKVVLDIECVDRVYLNRYVKYLQMPGGLITFIREQMGYPIPSPVVLPEVTQAFHKEVARFAAQEGLPIVDLAKDETAREHLAHFQKSSGMVLIGKAQEKASGYTARRKDRGTKVWVEYSRRTVFVTHYYFYVTTQPTLAKISNTLVNVDDVARGTSFARESTSNLRKGE
jgi:hypothetical protein